MSVGWMHPSGSDVLVGRDSERAQLERLLVDATQGSGHLVLLTGRPGIGKTRLAEELSAVAADRGVDSVWGHCVDDAGAPPLWPWLRLLAAAGGETAAVREALAAEPTTALEGTAARFRLVDAVASALLSAAGLAGLVVVLEDMHWADDSSLQVLRHLAADIAGSRLLVVITSRDAVSGNQPLARTFADASRQRGVSVLALGGLAAKDVAAYLNEATGSVPPPDLARAVQQRTGGLPLLLRAAGAVLSDAARDGLSLDVAPDSLLWRRMAEGTDVRRLVTASLAQLPAAATSLVSTASLLGEEVDLNLLTAVSEVEPDAVLAGLDAAVATNMLLPTATALPGYRFSHALVRDAVAAGIPASLAASVHRRAATVLEATAADDPVAAGRAAGHWLRAGSDPDSARRAVQAARRAAAEASRRFAHDSAMTLLTQALEASRRGGADAGSRAEVLIDLAVAQFLGGMVQPAMASSEAAAREASTAGRNDLIAASALVVHGIGDLDIIQRLGRLTDAALELPDLPSDIRARLHAQHACVMAELDQFADIGPESRLALDLAEASGDDRAILDAARARVLVLSGPDNVGEMLRVARLAADRAAATRQPLAELFGHVWQVDAAYLLGDMVRVESEMAAVARIAGERALPLASWHSLRMQASRSAFHGDFARGLELSWQASDVAVRIMEDPSAEGLSWAFMANLGLLLGTTVETTPQLWAELAAGPPLPIVRASYVMAYLMEGRWDEARELYEQLVPLLDDPPGDVRWMGTLMMMTRYAGVFDDPDAAALIYRLLLPWTANRGSWGTATVIHTGSVHRDAGWMAAVAGWTEKAEQHYRMAIEDNLRMQTRPFVALSRLGLAGVLHQRARSGVHGAAELRAEAVRLVRQAAGEFRRLGMPGPLADADRLLARLEAESRSADPLTAREHEVARLVAESLSNRQIADRLVLSERTIESHVRNILAKLGFANRTEIVSWALRPTVPPPTPRAARRP